MRKAIMLPLSLLVLGLAVYVYDGLQNNSWTHNAGLLVADVLIVTALFFALRKKDAMRRRREEEEKNN